MQRKTIVNLFIKEVYCNVVLFVNYLQTNEF